MINLLSTLMLTPYNKYIYKTGGYCMYLLKCPNQIFYLIINKTEHYSQPEVKSYCNHIFAPPESLRLIHYQLLDH